MARVLARGVDLSEVRDASIKCKWSLRTIGWKQADVYSSFAELAAQVCDFVLKFSIALLCYVNQLLTSFL